jgi:hypothetical protein
VAENAAHSPKLAPEVPGGEGAPTANPDPQSGSMAPSSGQDYSDGRKLWEWNTKYPPQARTCINNEACLLAISLIVLILLSGLSVAAASSLGSISIALWSSQPQTLIIDCRLIAIFLCGAVGGVTFSIKWLIHSAAKGSWHLDRRYWRILVPLVGGVYACVVVTLFDSGLMGAHTSEPNRSTASTAALAFLIGYFSDGVSGLLTNVANAVFGTLREK